MSTYSWPSLPTECSVPAGSNGLEKLPNTLTPQTIRNCFRILIFFTFKLYIIVASLNYKCTSEDTNKLSLVYLQQLLEAAIPNKLAS